MYLNNFTNNTCLYERDNICYFKDNIYNVINDFLIFYFEEKNNLPEYCYYNINVNVIQPIYFLLKNYIIYILLFSFIIKYRYYKKRILDVYFHLI